MALATYMQRARIKTSNGQLGDRLFSRGHRGSGERAQELATHDEVSSSLSYDSGEPPL